MLLLITFRKHITSLSLWTLCNGSVTPTQWKFESVTYWLDWMINWTNQLTGVGAKDACASKEVDWTFVQLDFTIINFVLTLILSRTGRGAGLLRRCWGVESWRRDLQGSPSLPLQMPPPPQGIQCRTPWSILHGEPSKSSPLSEKDNDRIFTALSSLPLWMI